MSRASRSTGVLAGLSACALLLSGCGDGGDSASNEPAETVTETVTESATASAESSPSGDASTSTEPSASTSPTASTSPSASTKAKGGGSPGNAGLPPKPRRDECVEIATPDDGRYTVYDAGRAVVKRNGDRLRVGKVSAARGWKARVTDRGGDDDVEIEFTPRRGPELELSVEIDDGRVESEICVDDRDDRDDRDDN